MPSLVPIERSEMTPEMWDKIRNYIVKQREKRKQEQEQDAEQERHRRELELKRKRDALTLEDIKDQVTRLEARVSELKAEKHDTFLKLKKVLNEEENRKKQREKEAELANQNQKSLNGHLYHPYYLSSPSMMSSANCQPSLYPRLGAMNVPMTSMVGSSVNSNVISHSSNHSQLIPVSAHSATSMANSALKRIPLKRYNEKSPSPPPRVPYTGILPVYKTSMAYTPTIPRTSQAGSYQLYYPQGLQSQVAYDVKGNPYHVFPNGAAFPAESQGIQGMDPYMYDANKYFQAIHQSRSNLVGPPHQSASTLIPIQPGQPKPGGISAGFPVQRVPSSNPGSSGQGRESRDPSSVPYPMYF